MNFTIKTQGVTVPTPEEQPFIYNGKLQTYVIVTDSRYEITGNTATEHGDYTAKIALRDKENYCWGTDGGTDVEDNTFDFTIAKRNVTVKFVDSVTASGFFNKNYDGDNKLNFNLAKTTHYTIENLAENDTTSDILFTSNTYGIEAVGDTNVTLTYKLDSETEKNYNLTGDKTKTFEASIIMPVTEPEEFEEEITITTPSGGGEGGATSQISEGSGTIYHNPDFKITLRDPYVSIGINMEDVVEDKGENNITIPVPQGGDCDEIIVYVRDNEGNISKVTLNHGVDTTAPKLEGSHKLYALNGDYLNDYFFNNKVVRFEINLTDSIGAKLGSGVDLSTITLKKGEEVIEFEMFDENGNKLSSTDKGLYRNVVLVAYLKHTPKMEVNADGQLIDTQESQINGTYTVTVSDNVGNAIGESNTVEISNHDNNPPIVTVAKTGSAYASTTNEWQGTGEYVFTITDDNALGTVTVKIGNNAEINATTDGSDNKVATFTYDFTENGIYSVVITATETTGAGGSTNTRKYLKKFYIDKAITELEEIVTKIGDVTGGDFPTDDETKDIAELLNKLDKLTPNQKDHITVKEDIKDEEGNVIEVLVPNGNKWISAKLDEIKKAIVDKEEDIDQAKKDKIKEEIDNIVNVGVPETPIIGTTDPRPTVEEIIDKITTDSDLAKEELVPMDEDTKKKVDDIDKVASVIDILTSEPDNYDQLNKWIETWEDLTDDQKKLAEKINEEINGGKEPYVTLESKFENTDGTENSFKEYKETVDDIAEKFKDLTVKTDNIEEIKALLKEVEDLKDVTSNLPEGKSEKDLLPIEVLDKLEQLENLVELVEKVKDFGKNHTVVEGDKYPELPEELNPTDEDYPNITNIIKEEIFENLTEEELDLLDPELKKEIEDKLKEIEDEENAGKDMIEELENQINDIKHTGVTPPFVFPEPSEDDYKQFVKDVEDAERNYEKLTEEEKSKLDPEYKEKLEKAIEEIEKDKVEKKVSDVEDLIDDIGNPPSPMTTDYIKKVEDAKIAYEKLTEEEKKLVDEIKAEKLISEYDNLNEYKKQFAQYVEVKDTDNGITVYGMHSKVDMTNVPDIEMVETVVLSIKAIPTDTVIENIPSNKMKFKSFDVKMFAKAGMNEPVVVQPKANETVVAEIPLGEIDDVSQIVIYHVKDNGSRKRVKNSDVLYEVKENNQTVAKITTSSFSEFQFLIDKVETPNNIGGSSNNVKNFWTDVKIEILYKNQTEIVANMGERGYSSVPDYVFKALQEVDKTLTLKFNEGDIVVSSDDLKNLEITSDSYDYESLLKLLNRSVVTPTPEPTEKPVDPEKPTDNKENCLICSNVAVVLGLCSLHFVVAVVVIAMVVVLAIIFSKKKK